MTRLLPLALALACVRPAPPAMGPDQPALESAVPPPSPQTVAIRRAHRRLTEGLPRLRELWRRADLSWDNRLDAHDDELLFTADGSHGHLLAIELGTGQTRWQVALEVGPNSRGASLPRAVSGDTVLVLQTGGELRALRRRDGKKLWSRRLEAEPGALAAAGGIGAAIACQRPNPSADRECFLHAFDLATGGERRRVSVVDTFRTQLVVSGDVYWLERGDERGRMRSLGLSGGARAWTTGTFADPFQGQLAVRDERVIMTGAGVIDVLRADTGERLWSQGDFSELASPAGPGGVTLIGPRGMRSLRLDDGQAQARLAFSMPDIGVTRNGGTLQATPDWLVASFTFQDEARTGYLVVAPRGQPPTAVRLPGIEGFEHGIAGDTLLFEGQHQGWSLAAYALARPLPPENSLTGADRVRAVLGRLEYEPVRQGREIADLPGAAAALASIARDQGAPIWLRANAVATMRVRPALATPAALWALAVAPAEPASAAVEGVSLGERALLALAGLDDLAIARRLLAAAAKAGPDREGFPLRAAIRELLWRNGWSSRLGVCPPAGELPPARPAGKGEVGTAHPLVFQDADPAGRWVFACQARADTDGDGRIAVQIGIHGDPYGDQMNPYLIRGSGAGEEIDDLVARDPAGRFLVTRKDACLALEDTTTGRRWSLAGADARNVSASFGISRAASLDEAGRRLLYLRPRDGKTWLVIRELDDGREREVEAGPGLLWRAALNATGDWALARFVTEDTDGDGLLGWPSTNTTLGARRCRGEAASYSFQGSTGDEPRVIRAASTSSGNLRELSGFQGTLGPYLLMRSSSGELRLDGAGGPHSTLAPASCRGRVLHTDDARQRALIACDGQGGLVEVDGPGQRQPLFRRWTAGGNFFVHGTGTGTPLVAFSGSLTDLERSGFELRDGLVDLERAQVRVNNTRILLQHGTRLLVRQGETLAIEDGRSTERVVLGQAPDLHLDAQSGSMAGVFPFVVDVATARLVGRTPVKALAVTRDGQALIPGSPEPGPGYGPPSGPLRWIRPR